MGFPSIFLQVAWEMGVGEVAAKAVEFQQKRVSRSPEPTRPRGKEKPLLVHDGSFRCGVRAYFINMLCRGFDRLYLRRIFAVRILYNGDHFPRSGNHGCDESEL